jgi:hypothetical protein
MAIEQIPQATIDKPKEITVSIPEDLLRELKWLSDILQVSPLIALRHAIAIDSYIQTELKKKSKFSVAKKDGSRLDISWASGEETEKMFDGIKS